MTLIAANTNQNGAVSLIFIAVIFLGMYLLMIRPQQRRRREYVDLLRSLEVGDSVETVAGIFGVIRRLSDDKAWVEVAPDTTLEMSRGAIRRKVVVEDEEESEGSDDRSS